jgi:RNA polymerase-interacting CarD/CdnL/TRCF family regulator
MVRKKIITRPAMTRPAALRRGPVTSEIRIYQELIRLAAERSRVLAEERMWAGKYQEFQRRLQAIERYQEDLLKRLSPPGRSPSAPPAKQDEGSPLGGNPVMKLRY